MNKSHYINLFNLLHIWAFVKVVKTTCMSIFTYNMYNFLLDKKTLHYRQYEKSKLTNESHNEFHDDDYDFCDKEINDKEINDKKVKKYVLRDPINKLNDKYYMNNISMNMNTKSNIYDSNFVADPVVSLVNVMTSSKNTLTLTHMLSK